VQYKYRVVFRTQHCEQTFGNVRHMSHANARHKTGRSSSFEASNSDHKDKLIHILTFLLGMDSIPGMHRCNLSLVHTPGAFLSKPFQGSKIDALGFLELPSGCSFESGGPVRYLL
jgi:hypothetical protein